MIPHVAVSRQSRGSFRWSDRGFCVVPGAPMQENRTSAKTSTPEDKEETKKASLLMLRYALAALTTLAFNLSAN